MESITLEQTALIYVAGVVLTFGHLVRAHAPRMKSMVWAAVWPLYWAVIHGVGGTIAAVIESGLKPLNQLLKYGDVPWFIWFVGAVFMPAYLLYERWDQCSGLRDCSMTVAQAVLWGPFWPAYVLAELLH